ERLRIQAHAGGVWSANFSPDGTRLVTAGADSLVKVWDLATGKNLLTLTGHVDIPDRTVGGFYNGVLVAVYSPDGTLIASAGEDGIVRVWDAVTGAQLYALQGHPKKIGLTNVCFSQDGSLLAATSDEEDVIGASVSLWKISRQSAEQIFSRTGLTDGRYWALAISPSNQFVVTGDSNGVLRLIPAKPGDQKVTELKDHAGTILSAAYSADGSILETSSRDGTVNIRNGKTLEVIKTIVPMHALSYSAISRDGKYLFTAGLSGIARVFLVKTEDLISLALSRLSRGFTQGECQQYLHVEKCPQP
ncbi:MAG: WD40 repeat domain-containing protein, partial [Omnitrophica WOR_2 bacterium]